MVVHRRLLSLLTMPVLLVGLLLAAESRADNKAKAQKPAPNKNKPAAALTEQIKFEEAAMLRKVFIMLAAANHDYNGHRVKAMHAAKAAFKILDGSIMKHGTAPQKAATVKENAAITTAEEAAKKTPMLHERQPASDAQLRNAAGVLAELRPTLATHQQKDVLKHVDVAIKEIKTALTIR
jgi:hypothetical protein